MIELGPNIDVQQSRESNTLPPTGENYSLDRFSTGFTSISSAFVSLLKKLSANNLLRLCDQHTRLVDMFAMKSCYIGDRYVIFMLE